MELRNGEGVSFLPCPHDYGFCVFLKMGHLYQSLLIVSMGWCILSGMDGVISIQLEKYKQLAEELEFKKG